MPPPPPETVFDTFYKKFVHRTLDDDGPWYEARGPRTCHAVVKLQWNDDETQSFQMESGGGQFVVPKIISELNNRIQPQQEGMKKKVYIKIYMNFSPSAVCSNTLIEFKQRNDPEVRMDVVFSSLYNIRRESCLSDQCRDHVNLIDATESGYNAAGLRNMAEACIGLKTFSADDWIFLAGHLGVNDFEANTLGNRELAIRWNEDCRVASDLRAILHPPGAGLGGQGPGGQGPGGQGPGGQGPGGQGPGGQGPGGQGPGGQSPGGRSAADQVAAVTEKLSSL